MLRMVSRDLVDATDSVPQDGGRALRNFKCSCAIRVLGCLWQASFSVTGGPLDGLFGTFRSCKPPAAICFISSPWMSCAGGGFGGPGGFATFAALGGVRDALVRCGGGGGGGGGGAPVGGGGTAAQGRRDGGGGGGGGGGGAPVGRGGATPLGRPDGGGGGGGGGGGAPVGGGGAQGRPGGGGGGGGGETAHGWLWAGSWAAVGPEERGLVGAGAGVADWGGAEGGIITCARQ